MITPERLETLRFQSEHNGHNPQTIARMRKEGKPLNENGVMIQVSPAEMRELLRGYKEKEQ